MKRIWRRNYLKYVHSEVIQLLDLLKMWGSLGKELFFNRVDDLKLEELLKCNVTTKRRIC